MKCTPRFVSRFDILVQEGVGVTSTPSFFQGVVTLGSPDPSPWDLSPWDSPNPSPYHQAEVGTHEAHTPEVGTHEAHARKISTSCACRLETFVRGLRVCQLLVCGLRVCQLQLGGFTKYSPEASVVQ